MNRLRRYFQSFDSFVQFLYGLKRRINGIYYRIFGKIIAIKLNDFVKENVDNKSFLSSLNRLCAIPIGIQSKQLENERFRQSADLSINGIFNLLGSGDVLLTPINWHTDFKSGFKWNPGIFYKSYIQEGIESNSDVKVPRELSRCHHFLKLGIAYQITKDEKYAQLCINQLQDWIKENPLMYSINWGCTMDVAIRAVNWIWALGLMAQSTSLNENDLQKIKVSLYQHGSFIYRNPERELTNNHNHYLADLAGQIHLGLLFNELEEPKRWLEKGKLELFHEIRLQVLPTGMSYERSTNYNRLVVELILIPTLLLKNDGHEIPSDIWYRLEKMLEFIMYSLKPNGETPIIGDQDNGRLLPFGTENRNDYRYLLSLGSILFSRADFKKQGDGFNIYCLLLGGKDAFKKWDAIKAEEGEILYSKPFKDAGFFVMRRADYYMLFNASGKGMFPETIPYPGTHTHSDLLSFELFARGKTFLVDPGSYVYTADAAMRLHFRSTAMHNTVSIDGQSQNVLKKEMLWDFERNAIPKVLAWESNQKQDFVKAEHNGYTRFSNPVTHQRSVLFDKIKGSWEITDSFTGEGVHDFCWHFHFDVDIDFMMDNNKLTTTCVDTNNIQMIFDCKQPLQFNKKHSFVSKGYGERQDAFELEIKLKANCDIILKTIIQSI